MSNWLIMSTIIEDTDMLHDHPHPGELLREDVIRPAGLSVSHAAQCLGMSRVALSRVLNGKAAISPDLAIRLEMAGISTAQAWLSMQMNYDLSRARQTPQPMIVPLKILASESSETKKTR